MNSGRDCVRAWEAMPWVLQDSATQKQRDWLQSHLAQCESCRAEFAQQSRLRRAVALPSDIAVDANVGLKRLLSRLDAPGQYDAAHAARSGNRFSRILIAVVLIQALGIGALSMQWWSAGQHPPYQTLSQAPSPPMAGAIRVVPDAAMTLADWNALLHTLRLQVVSGPNAVGAYALAPTDATPTDQALQQLRATRGIRLAEPVAATP
jgi:hypothetical protein